ncbi:diguanylate cyclase/phosphodiesterase [Anaerobacterium chartisolvens]|uniref:Diguanylate cyclase/phosphodiesterase n=1 Tax=Anaerobacterium chartisolvens TaxID=1297424 RepID=A0A369BHZ1_9FIRM|nr:GGDEF domain-containing protein [Anaerobacterium chartisolvens]RCX19294.1 diguanylate cyclase/phosphodiesterase [Anaerobacterium chartisolvens]
MDAIAQYNNKYYSSGNMGFRSFDTLEKESNLGDEFMDILKTGNITTVFQPIISLKDAGVLGYEALSRGPSSSSLESPSHLFDLARIYGKLWELEFLCRIKALENLCSFSHHFNIFLNVDPEIINDEKFKKGFTKEFLKQFDINPENIVFEITERNCVSDLKVFKKVIDNYKDQGYKIAIDDAGSGYSGLKLITDIHPQYIKLDMNLIRDIDKDGLKHALIKTFYEFCLVTDIKLIAEGIETEDELNALIDIGINYGQGYLIQRPQKQVSDIDPYVTELIKSRNNKKSLFYFNRPSTVCIGDICRSCMYVTTDQTGSSVLDIYNNCPSVLGLPVVDSSKVQGLIMRDKFYAKLATQYGFALFLNRPVTLVMDKRPLSVDYETTIDIVSKLSMTRSEENLYDYVIVTKDSGYYGIVTVKDLLEKTTELEVNYAKHLNPLSGLPGNILIEQRLEEYIKKTAPYTVLYIDIDNFKVYNDVYGFENGDRMLQFVGRMISSTVSHNCSCTHFVGHIGGDDFIIILDTFDVEDTCRLIMDNFSKGIPNFYTSEDLERKYTIAKNRHGIEEQFGLSTISIAGVSNRHNCFKDIYELSECAVRVKKKCKEVWENCFHIL